MAMTGGTAKLVKSETPSGWSGQVNLYVYYKISQDKDNNKSTIYCGMYVTTPSGWGIGSWTDFKGSYVGTTSNTFSGTIPNFSGTRWLVENKQMTVTHNDDGTAQATIYWRWGVNSYADYKYTNYPSGSFTITLPTIPRASTITSASNITLGKQCNIKWTPASSSYKYKIKFSLGNWNYTTGYISPGTTSAYTYTGYTIKGTTTANNTTIYNELGKSSSGTMTATLTTYNSSGTPIGSSSSKTFTVTVSSDDAPTVGTIKLDPVNITTADGSNRDILVKGKNKLNISISGSAPCSGSSIKSYTFSGQNVSSTITSSSTSCSMTSSGTINPSISGESTTLTYKVTVLDARGVDAYDTETILCYNYAEPVFKSFAAYRANKDGVATSDGMYIKCTYQITYSNVNGTNKIYSFSISGTGSKNITYSGWETSTSNGVVTASGSALINLGDDTTSTFNVYASVKDNYNSSKNSSTTTVHGGARIINIYPDGTGIALGKMAEDPELFECVWPAKFDNNITFGDGVQCGLKAEQNGDGVNIAYLMTGQNTSTGKEAGLAVHNTSVYVPSADNSGIVNLGSGGRKWNQLYAANSTISTSDRNMKKNIESMSDTQEQLFNALKPVTYKMISGTGDRTHYGFVAQDVEDALIEIGLSGKDFAGFCKDIRVDDNGKNVLGNDGKVIYDYSLRYSEFIALNTYMIQKLQKEIVELKAEIEELKLTAQN